MSSTALSGQARLAGATLVKMAGVGEKSQLPPGDSVQLGQTPPLPTLERLKTAATSESVHFGTALKKLARAGFHAAVGAATMGAATAFCGLGMMVSHNATEGDNGFLLSSGVTIGTLAGLTAGLFSGSWLVGLATFGGISQGMIGLTDWAVR